MKQWFASLALVALAATAQAEAPAVQFYSSVGTSWGGDTLVRGTYTNTNEEYSINAGTGTMLNVGVSVAFSDTVAGVLTIGKHSVKTNGSNGDFAFRRDPVELLGFYAINQNWRVGGGVRSADSAKLSASGVVSYLGERNLSNSLGTVLEVQYLFDKMPGYRLRYGFAGRYVIESFDDQITKRTFSGNHMGVSFIFMY